jgi:hypothetical protein
MLAFEMPLDFSGFVVSGFTFSGGLIALLTSDLENLKIRQ